MEWVASTLHTTSVHGVSSISTADAHTSVASSRLNWRPAADLNGLVRFARKTKSGFCARASTFQLASTRIFVASKFEDPFLIAVFFNFRNFTIESYWEKKLYILRVDSIGHCERKVHMNLCLILNGYRGRAVSISRPNSVRTLCMSLDEFCKRNLDTPDKLLASIFRRCCRNTETWRSTQTSNTRSSHTSCKAHWGWRWDLWIFILNCNKSGVYV